MDIICINATTIYNVREESTQLSRERVPLPPCIKHCSAFTRGVRLRYIHSKREEMVDCNQLVNLLERKKKRERECVERNSLALEVVTRRYDVSIVLQLFDHLLA